MSTKEQPRPLDIHGLLDLARAGVFPDEVNEKIRKTIAAVKDVRGKGKVTVTFAIACSEDDDGVTVRSTCDSVEPKRTPRKDFLFVDATGRIYTEDPSQLSLDLKVTRIEGSGQRSLIQRTAESLGVPVPGETNVGAVIDAETSEAVS